MYEKPSWPDGQISPWADDPDPPTVFEVAAAYPGRALGNAFMAMIFGTLVTAFVGGGIVWLINSLTNALVGAALLTSPVPLVVLLPFVVAGVWWGGMHGEIRGWWISDSSDAD